MPTAFVTNMDRHLARSCPDLCKLIEVENGKNLKATRKSVPKYVYPDCVLTAADLGYMAKHGIAFSVDRESCFFIRGLDSQRASGKAIFGSGFLLSERAAAERAAAEKWQLSERERQIVNELR